MHNLLPPNRFDKVSPPVHLVTLQLGMSLARSLLKFTKGCNYAEITCFVYHNYNVLIQICPLSTCDDWSDCQFSLVPLVVF